MYAYQVCVSMTRRSASRGLLYSAPPTTETEEEQTATEAGETSGEAAAADD
jgi:hypothetical protein